MSVVVKDMNVPAKCTDCRFMVDGWCYAICLPEDQPDSLPLNGKPEWCPLSDGRKNVSAAWIDSDVNESGLENTVSLLCENCGNYTEFALVGTPKDVMDTMRFCPRCGSMNGGNEK